MSEVVAYYRKSVVKDGDKDVESTEVQRMKCTEYAKSRGWELAEEFIDEGISASKGLYRPSFQKLMERIEAGKVAHIIVREQARLSREDLELLIFLKAVQKHNVQVWDSAGREIKNDLQTKVKAMVDTDYADSVKKNSTEHQEYIAASGKPPGTGHRPYGYVKNYASVIESEAKVIRDVAKRLIAGETLYSIVKDLNARGILKYSGKTWKSQDLSKVMGRAENAAIRTYKGAEAAKGQWPAILDESTYRKVKEKLDKNTAYSTTTTRKYLLVGILVCDLCGVKLSAKQPSYWCSPSRGGCGKITRNIKAVDDYMLRRVYEYIKLLPKPSEEPVEDPTEAKLRKLEQDLEELQATKEDPDSEMTFGDYARFAARLREQIKTLRKQQLKTVPLPVDDAASFIDAGTDKQRDTIRRIYPVVGVRPTGRKGLRFDPDQLVF